MSVATIQPTQYSGGDPTTAVKELKWVLERAIDNNPRSLQKRIGPSELGTDCDRCLISKLAGIEEKRESAWLPTVGTAVHAWAEKAVNDYSLNELIEKQLDTRFVTEHRVHVGDVGGEEIWGTTDVFDIITGTIIDYKIVGKSTLTNAKAKGASNVYRKQQHLYGLGWRRKGFMVAHVAVWYLPRDEPSLANAVLWTEPWNPQLALDALARADMFATGIAVYGAEHVLSLAAPHIGDFSCTRFPSSDGTFPSAQPGHVDQWRAFGDLFAVE